MSALHTLPSASAVVAATAGKANATATASKAGGASAPTDPAAGEVSFAEVLSAQLGLSSTAPTAMIASSKDKEEGPASDDQAVLSAVPDIPLTDPASAVPFIPLALPVAVLSAAGEDIEQDAPHSDQPSLVAKTFLPSAETRRSPFISEQPASESPATEAAPVPANFAAALQGLPAPVQDAPRREHALSDAEASPAPLPVATPALASEQATHRAAPLVTAVPVPVRDARWSNAFSERVVWITGQHVQSAEIHIEPPQLGPIELRVSITNDQANLLINAPHAVARDAIQMSLPRLQEMLMESGLTLGNVSVGAHNAGGQQTRDGADRGTNRSGSDAVAGVDAASTQTPLRIQRGLGLVDLFA